MEALTRIVAESLARHGFDNPLDPRRLQWSRWSRCDSPRSLLVVPSKPGIFAIAEEIMDLGTGNALAADGKSRGPSPPEARRPPIFRRRRHGLYPRSHVHPHPSHARSPRFRTLLPALRRPRRPCPAPQHLQRSQSVDALLGGKSLGPPRLLLDIGTDGSWQGRCGSDTLFDKFRAGSVRQRRHHRSLGARNVVGGNRKSSFPRSRDPAPAAGFGSQQEPALSSPTTLRLLNRRRLKDLRQGVLPDLPLRRHAC